MSVADTRSHGSKECGKVIVALHELTRTFGELVAVDHLSLEVAEGEIFGLVGPDGAGKTTTLRMLACLIEPTSGWARVADYDVSRQPQSVKDSIGYMAQRFGLYADLTVDENLAFYADLFGVSGQERARLLPDLFRMTRMEPFRGRHAGRLSGGMKQKLALMCTLIHHPKVLFLDEPTNGVDPVSRRDFWTILYQLAAEGVTVFVTTSYLDEAERCSRVALVHRGKLIRCDTPAKLKRSLPMRSFEVSAPDIRTLRRWLETQPSTAGVEPTGNVLHLFAMEEPEVIAKRIVANGFGPVTVNEIVPSLEDIFIATVRSETRAS
jgi:ABC-2 type transport system ATP-binding protein